MELQCFYLARGISLKTDTLVNTYTPVSDHNEGRSVSTHSSVCPGDVEVESEGLQH